MHYRDNQHLTACSAASRFLLLVLAIVCLNLSLCTEAQADLLTMRTANDRESTWHLTADKVITHSDEQVIEAIGNVALRQGNEYLKADYARYYSTTKWVFLQGNVFVRLGAEDIEAREAEFDLTSRVGWLRDGKIFMEGPHIYFAGEHINKHWGDVYTFHQAKITACDGDVPAWSLTAKEAVVELDGYARLTGSKFQIADTPVLYSPWFVLPAKSDRQSGLLPPEQGQSSTRGLYYNQPYFWAINDHSDLTFNEYWMEKRGFMHGLEYRARPSASQNIWFRADYLNDNKKILDPTDDDAHDNLLRNNADRYWLRGMYSGNLGDPRWEVKIDLDYVSDDYFLRDFENGMSGFSRSRDELFNTFNRDIREKDQDRRSGILISRDWERVSVALSSTYTQNTRLGNGNIPRAEDTTVQELPRLDAFLHKGKLLETMPFEFQAQGHVVNMYRATGTRGTRAAFNPELSLPIHSKYGSITGTVSLLQTFYNTENRSNMPETDPVRIRDGHTATPRETDDNRTMLSYGVEASTEFLRTYSLGAGHLAATKENLGKSQWTDIQHSIQPRISYQHIPMDDQSRLPYYDHTDRIGPRTEITYSVSNILTRKRSRIVAKKAQNATAPTADSQALPNGNATLANNNVTPELQTDYLDFLRFRLAQSYNIREANRVDDIEKFERRPFGDIRAEIDFTPLEYVAFTTRSYWSPHSTSLTRHDHDVTLSYPGYGSLRTGLSFRDSLSEYTRYRDTPLRIFYVDAIIPIYGPWTIGLEYEADMYAGQDLLKGVSVTYTDQCYQIVGGVMVEPDETSFNLQVVLMGF